MPFDAQRATSHDPLDPVSVAGYGASVCFQKTPQFVWTSLLPWKGSPRFLQVGVKHLPPPPGRGEKMAMFSKHQSSVPSKTRDPGFLFIYFLITNDLSSRFYGWSGLLWFYVYIHFGYPAFFFCIEPSSAFLGTYLAPIVCRLVCGISLYFAHKYGGQGVPGDSPHQTPSLSPQPRRWAFDLSPTNQTLHWGFEC